MTPDDRADALEEIDEDRAEEILSEIPTEAREKPSGSSRTTQTPPVA